MRRIRISAVLLPIVLSALWWLTDRTNLFAVDSMIGWRNLLLQYTGIVCIGAMSVTMLLALRPVCVETFFGGLDKMYRLHKWLGITALVSAVLHWWINDALRPSGGRRPPRPPVDESSLDSIQLFFLEHRHLAVELGDFMFKIVVVLLALALIKRFPYRWFFKSHRLLAISYLVLAFHSAILTEYAYWSGPLGPVMAVLLAAGTIAAVLILFRQFGVRRQVNGKVATIARYDTLGSLEIDVQTEGGWRGHQAGQFAFLRFDKSEGAHPFTISSDWAGDGHLRFLIKALGDHTRDLFDRLKVGDPVRVEGPYGRFTFEGSSARQIWIGGGIGITPFMARLQALAHQSGQADSKSIDLFHSTTNYDQHFVADLERSAATAGARLHLLWDERDGFLNAERIAQAVPQWRDADVWFCGPAKFGAILKAQLKAMGMPETRFHQELFEMR